MKPLPRAVERLRAKRAQARVPVTEGDVVQAMARYGGSFVRALAQACHAADPVNLAKIKATWPEYWTEYTELARLAREPRP